MTAATTYGHPTVRRLYIPEHSRVGDWLRDRYGHAPFGRAAGNPNSTSIELTKSQRKLYKVTPLGDLWIGKACYRVARLDRDGLSPLVEFDLADKRMKAPKLHVSHLIGDTEAHARCLYEMLSAEADDAATVH